MAIARPTYPYDTAPQRAEPALALVIALHIVVVAALLSLDVLPLPVPLAALMVRVVQAHVEQAAEPAKITPPRPKSTIHKTVAQSHPKPAPERPLLAAETQTPAAVEAPANMQIAPPAPLPIAATAPPAAAVSDPRYDAAYLDNPAPVYPPLSRRMGEEGRVVLRVFVEPNGRPSHIHVRTSSGAPRLDQAAQDAVSRWKFFPALRGAEAIGAWVLVPIAFKLRG